MPLDPRVARKIRDMDEKPIELMNNLEAGYEQKEFDDDHIDISKPKNKHQ